MLYNVTLNSRNYELDLCHNTLAAELLANDPMVEFFSRSMLEDHTVQSLRFSDGWRRDNGRGFTIDRLCKITGRSRS